MFGEALAGFASVFSIGPITGITFGVLVGLIFGAIPGVSGIMAVAILLPATFYVSPIIGIPMLLGIYKAGIFGGSISAILLNTPGAPPAVCTGYDGYPLAQQGKAGKALNTAIIASVSGDSISNLVLIFVAAPLSLITLKAGPIEKFSILILALTVVGSISGSSIVKGIISCAFGMFISTIGISETTGAVRMTFGLPQMTAGISLIPMVIGLLCLPEIVNQVSRGAKDVYLQIKKSTNPDDNRLTWKEFKGLVPTILKSSGIGMFMGAMPGLGASPGAFMAYSEAQRTSKHPEKFGKGALEGVAAPESANNATTGAAMIPMLTLGIPGDDVTAVLMGAFLIQGITPGPTIFYEHTSTIYGIYGGLLICDVLILCLAKLGVNTWIKFANLPRHIIFSFVTIFCFVGSYSINQSLFDVLVLIIFGLIGYFVIKKEFSAGAIIIGFILGTYVERTFEQSMTLSNGDPTIFLTNPISAVFLFLALFSCISVARRRARVKKGTK